MDTYRYPLTIENLRNDVTSSDVYRLLDWPNAEILERNIDIVNNGPTSTAFLFFTRPDVAFEMLNLKEPKIDGYRVTIRPQLFEETSITFSGSWLREIEDENAMIQVELKKLAEDLQLRLVPQESNHGKTETISFTGVPWRIEQARTRLNDMIQPIIMKRSSNVQKKYPQTNVIQDVAGFQSQEINKWDSSTGVEGMRSINEDRKHGLTPKYPGTLNDPKSDEDCKGSTESDNANQGNRRIRKLVKTGEAKSEPSEVVATVSNTDVHTNQQIDGKRKRVLVVPKPEEMQDPDSSVDALGKSTPIDYPASTQHQRVIKVDIDIHRYLVEHPNVLDFSDCSVSQKRVSEQHYDWIFGNSNEKDLQTNEEELKDLIAKLKTRCYSAPNEFDFLIFKDLVKSENKNENVSLIFIPKERICKIVGPKNAVKTTYEWISNISDDLIKANKQKSGKGQASEVRTYDTRSSAQKLDAQQSGSLGYSAESKVHKTDVGRYPDPKQHVPKAGSGIYISKSSQDKLEFTTLGKLRVSVYQGNMIKQPTEVIVNPANDQLAHGGGLARVILDAGGQVIDDEGRQIIAKQGKLKTSEVVHTSAGKLPPPIRYVIHAVGPTAHEFKDNKAGLVPTLKVTFQNCLEYANKLGVASISLPPISSGIFAVPIPDIIQGAVEAIQDFDRKTPSSALKEVHFISNDAKTTEEMISCFRNVIG